MGPDADEVRLRRHRSGTPELHAPVRHKDPRPARAGGDIVLAAGEPGGGFGAGASEELVHGAHRLRAPLVHHADPAAVAVYLPPVVGDPHRRTMESRQGVRQFQLQLIFEVAVQGGKGLVQQQKRGLRGKDAGQGHPLLLAAGELKWPLALQPLQMEGPDLFRHHSHPAIPLGHGGADVLFHTHVGKEGILLEEVAHPPPLRRQVHPAWFSMAAGSAALS